MIKKVVAISLAGVLLLSCTGCGSSSKEKELQATVTALQNEIADLNAELANSSVTGLTTSLQTVEGKKVPEFKFVEDTIVFPNRLNIPSSVSDIVTATVKVGSKYSIAPSNNWLIKCESSKLNLTHSAKVWGNVAAVTVEEQLKTVEQMQPIIQQFFNGFPATTINYRQLFVDGTLGGLLADAPIVVEDQNYHVVVGFHNKSSYGILFLFTYLDDGSGVQSELVTQLISSCKYGDSNIAIE